MVNSGDPNKLQPWVTPDGYKVTAVIDDIRMGGKFVVYQNKDDNTVLLTAMGTNGNSDLVGWYANFKDQGLSQWESSDIKERVFKALNDVVDGATKVIINGDSKGDALAQFITFNFINLRDEDKLGSWDNLKDLSNERIGLVAAVGPAIGDALHQNGYPDVDLMSEKYRVSALYFATRATDGSSMELVHLLGGQKLASQDVRYLNVTPTGDDASILNLYQCCR